MSTHYRCGRFFNGLEDEPRLDHTLVVDGDTISYAGPSDAAPQPNKGDEVVDYSEYFVMPGLSDAHTHCSFGAQQQLEEIDMYAPLEFRALRAVINAQRVLQSGHTALIDPGSTGRVMVSVRDAINSGMFKGPRITCSGPFVSTYQGYTAFYPTWFNNPTAVVELVHDLDGGFEILRRQVKDGVDFIKIAMDGSAIKNGELAATWTQDDTTRLIGEAHRLGKRVIAHAKGREGALRATRAGVDVIYHYSWMDNEVLDAVLENGTVICPSLTIIGNRYRYTHPTDPHGRARGSGGKKFDDGRDADWDGHGRRPDMGEKEWAGAVESARKAHAAGVTIMCGSDSGFAVNPCGEWHAQEIVDLVKHIGLSEAEALRSATSVNAWFLTGGDRLGSLEAGKLADFIVVDGDPLTNIEVLLDKPKIKQIYVGGELAKFDVGLPTNEEYRFSYRMWQEIYDQKAVKELAAASKLRVMS